MSSLPELFCPCHRVSCPPHYQKILHDKTSSLPEIFCSCHRASCPSLSSENPSVLNVVFAWTLLSMSLSILFLHIIRKSSSLKRRFTWTLLSLSLSILFLHIIIRKSSSFKWRLCLDSSVHVIEYLVPPHYQKILQFKMSSLPGLSCPCH